MEKKPKSFSSRKGVSQKGVMKGVSQWFCYILSLRVKGVSQWFCYILSLRDSCLGDFSRLFHP